MESKRHYLGEKTGPLAGSGFTPPRQENDRSWMDVLSFVYRPAWSLLQRYFPGNALSAQPQGQLWGPERFEDTLGFGSKARTLQDLSNRQPQHACCDNGLSPLVEVGELTWLTTDSLSEIGIHTIPETVTPQASGGYLSSARNLFSQLFMQNVLSSQEVKQSPNSVAVRGVNSDSLSSSVSVLSWSKETTIVMSSSDAHLHCGSLCHLAECSTVAAVAKPTTLFVHTNCGSLQDSESAGLCTHKAATDNGSPLTSRSASSATEEPKLCDLVNTASSPGDVKATYVDNRAVVQTPDQDHGYSSLEEELSNSRLHRMRPIEEELAASSEIAEEEQQISTVDPLEEESGSSVPPLFVEACIEEDVLQETDLQDQTKQEEQREVPEAASQGGACRNKAIAYIMGSPCSDESESDDDTEGIGSDDEEVEEEDDDGFSSEGSSCLSQSDSSVEEDEDDDYDEQSDGEAFDAETERLWNSLCQNRDPYNPRNFTAPISTAPRSSSQPSLIPSPFPSPASQSSDSPSPLWASPLSTSPLSTSPFASSPPCASALSSRRSSSSGSGEEADEAESLKLWDSFSCSLDPYNPFNFQAPQRTRLAPSTGALCKAACSIPRYQREQAEERQDSGFGEEVAEHAPAMSHAPQNTIKKVRFCEEVEEFYASGDEDRRGPWEEYARDRCRFQRRVLEVEESIAFCLAPTFRLQVLRRFEFS